MMISFTNLFGCSNSGYDFTFVVENQRSQGWTDILIQSSNGLEIPFAVVAGAWSTYDGFFKDPLNVLYLVSWTNELGIKYSVEADIRESVSKNFSGCIYFTINDQNILTYSASREYRGQKLFEKTAQGIKKVNE